MRKSIYRWLFGKRNELPISKTFIHVGKEISNRRQITSPRPNAEPAPQKQFKPI